MTNDRVIAIRGRIDPAVIEIERQLDFRMLGEKRIESRPQMQAAEGDGCGDAQRSYQRTAPLGEIGRSLANLLRDAGRALQKGSAILRQGQLAGRAMEQGSAQCFFHFRQAFADHGFRQTQPTRRLADRAGLGYSHECHDPVDLQHRSETPNSNSSFCRLIRTIGKGHVPRIGQTERHVLTQEMEQ